MITFCFYPYLEDKVIPKPQVLAGGAPKDPKAQLGRARGRILPCSAAIFRAIFATLEEIWATSFQAQNLGKLRKSTHPGMISRSSQAADGLLPDQRGRPSHPTFGGIWVWKWATAYFFSPRSMGEWWPTRMDLEVAYFQTASLGKIWTIQFWCVWVSSGAMWSSNTSKKCCFCSQKHRKTIKTYSNTMGYVPGVC